MTIKEAVELYNANMNRIKRIEVITEKLKTKIIESKSRLMSRHGNEIDLNEDEAMEIKELLSSFRFRLQYDLNREYNGTVTDDKGGNDNDT